MTKTVVERLRMCLFLLYMISITKHVESQNDLNHKYLLTIDEYFMLLKTLVARVLNIYHYSPKWR